ncbi:IS4 family transposase, partial [Lactobacillus delbrueckii subsp. bulgaricus]|nr:IS4 family transposase [Lactobacillus delbrueckii subsp. bulgaricus]
MTVNRNATIKDKRTIAAKRRIVAQSKGTDVVIQLLDQALKAGLTAKYVM